MFEVLVLVEGCDWCGESIRQLVSYTRCCDWFAPLESMCSHCYWHGMLFQQVLTFGGHWPEIPVQLLSSFHYSLSQIILLGQFVLIDYVAAYIDLTPAHSEFIEHFVFAWNPLLRGCFLQQSLFDSFLQWKFGSAIVAIKEGVVSFIGGLILHSSRDILYLWCWLKTCSMKDPLILWEKFISFISNLFPCHNMPWHFIIFHSIYIKYRNKWHFWRKYTPFIWFFCFN